MTSFAFILICVPLYLASGAGGFSRRILGTTVIAGMSVATGVAIFLIAKQKLAEVTTQLAASVGAYEEAVRIANIRYLSGLSSYFEVVDAQQQLFPAENALARARRDELIAIVSLYKSLGGGWQPPPQNP